MSDAERPPGLQTSGEGKKPGAYQPPAIEREEEIEVQANLASACNKLGSDDPCQSYSTS